VVTHRDRGEIDIQANLAKVEQEIDLGRMWLTDIRADGKCAFRVIDGGTIVPMASEVAKCSTRFTESDFATENLEKLKSEMHAHLVQRGLYDDEAVAMLTTWERAYFESAGLRLFYLVPDVWVDATLPLDIPQAAQIERVMIGRIELISDRQQELLDKIAAGPISSASWVGKIKPSPESKKFFSGHEDFGDLNVEFPEDYANYMELGRFRNALIVAEKNRTESKNLQLFINSYGLKPFDP
jgi:hypothetical protein